MTVTELIAKLDEVEDKDLEVEVLAFDDFSPVANVEVDVDEDKVVIRIEE